MAGGSTRTIQDDTAAFLLRLASVTFQRSGPPFQVKRLAGAKIIIFVEKQIARSLKVAGVLKYFPIISLISVLFMFLLIFYS